MDVDVLHKQFVRIGARARVRQLDNLRVTTSVSLDIVHDRFGELFDIQISRAQPVEVEVLQVDPKQRHLLLMSRSEEDKKHKYLCGHDERHWFVAAVPEHHVVSTVRTAIEALKPVGIVDNQVRQGVRRKNWNRRRNEAFIRQGEWFFVPEPELYVNRNLILTNEPISRGRGKPHMVEFLYRAGGETVYVSPQRPTGIDSGQHAKLMALQPEAKYWNWSVFRRDAVAYAKGRIRHSDHATVTLREWCRILMNTESEAAAMRHVLFLD